MNSYRAIILLSSILMLSGFAAASSHVDFPSETVEYGNSFTTNYESLNPIICDQLSGSGCPGSADSDDSDSAYMKLKGCTGRQMLDSRGGDWGGSIGDDKTLFRGTANIPGNIQCGLGDHEIQLYRTYNDELVAEGGNVEVTARNMNAHKGYYMYISSNINEGNLQDFILSDDLWSESVDQCETSPSFCYSSINIEEVDGLIGGGNEYAAWRLDPGEKITPSTGDSLESIISGSVYDGKPEYASGSLGDGSCSNDPCAIGKASFTTGNGIANNIGKYSKNLDSATPVSSGSNRMPQGEVINAFEPHAYDQSGNELNTRYTAGKIFICRDGATMDNGFGSQVPQVVDKTSDKDDDQLVKCDQGTGEWNPTIPCEDGLDNDADGDIDNSDRSCQEGNNIEDGSVPPPTCDAGDVIVEGSGSLSETMVACYETGGGNIQKQPYEDWSWTEDIGGPSLTAWAPKDPQIKDCNRGTTPRPEGCLSSSEYANHWSSDMSMPTVEYGAWSDYFVDLAQLQGKEEEFRNGNYALETDFTAKNIGWITQWQPLYTAERRYDADQTGLTPNPDNCDRCNDPDWWKQVNMSYIGDQSASTRYYDSSTALEHEDAWIVGNAGSEAVDGVESQALIPSASKNTIFNGGWMVECDDSQVLQGENNWRYDSDIGAWACQGIQSKNGGGIIGTQTDDPVEVPGFSTTTYLPDTETTSNGKREIGLIQFPYLNRDASNRPDYLPSEVSTYVEAAASNGINDQINEIEAKCWTGGLGQEPSSCTSGNGCFTDTASYSSTDPWGVAQEVSTNGRSGYACKWAYKTDKFNDGNSNADGVVGDESSVTVHLHRNQNQGDNYHGFWQDITGQYPVIKKEYQPGELTGLLP